MLTLDPRARRPRALLRGGRGGQCGRKCRGECDHGLGRTLLREPADGLRAPGEGGERQAVIVSWDVSCGRSRDTLPLFPLQSLLLLEAGAIGGVVTKGKT